MGVSADPPTLYNEGVIPEVRMISNGRFDFVLLIHSQGSVTNHPPRLTPRTLATSPTALGCRF